MPGVMEGAADWFYAQSRPISTLKTPLPSLLELTAPVPSTHWGITPLIGSGSLIVGTIHSMTPSYMNNEYTSLIYIIIKLKYVNLAR